MYSINFILLIGGQFLLSKKFNISGSCIIFVDAQILLIRFTRFLNSEKDGSFVIICDNSFEFFLKIEELNF
ncbi:MAG: hypothetical protein Q8K37_03915, partial [Alphaproteobacteria bacterium]|nr:hypothetical protein [Alphaproteobacteria bacterium]